MQSIVQPRSAPIQEPGSGSSLGLDRFTISIGVAVILLVAGLFVLVLRQPPAQRMDESTPSGVVNNYYLAVQQNQLSQAYGYLAADTRTWLSYEQFTAQVSTRPQTRSVRIDNERLEGTTAVVSVSITRYTPTGFFSNAEVTSSQSLVLRRDGDAWRIALPQPPGGPYVPYELYGW
jgi:hypothetical protein